MSHWFNTGLRGMVPMRGLGPLQGGKAIFAGALVLLPIGCRLGTSPRPPGSVAVKGETQQVEDQSRILLERTGASHPPIRQEATQPMRKGNPSQITNSIEMELVEIPAGDFLMGNPSFPLAHPVHTVTLSQFWMSKTEVTVAQFERFRKRQRHPESPSPNHPVTRVSWLDCIEFCRWLSQKEGRKYRLPTEAEWEYAARGGLVQKDYPWGDEPPAERAQFGSVTAAAVGSFPPNGFGLYDMAGNVEEWVADWADGEGPKGESLYYQQSPRKDPLGPAQGSLKRIRDGSYDMYELRCYLRTMDLPSASAPQTGFRIVLDPALGDQKRQAR